jgi:hypothetical protein
MLAVLVVMHLPSPYGGAPALAAVDAAAIASTAGLRWALIGPGLVITVCAAALLKSPSTPATTAGTHSVR